MSLDEMTDEQVLDAWHAAKMAQKFATTEDPTVRMALKLKAEALQSGASVSGDIWRPIDGASQRKVPDVPLSMRSSASSESRTSMGWQRANQIRPSSRSTGICPNQPSAASATGPIVLWPIL